MSEIDAAELARLRAEAKAGHYRSAATVHILDLIDALEKARGERDIARESYREVENALYSARTLLGKALPFVRGTMTTRDGVRCCCSGCESIRTLRALISAELESKS